MKLTTTLLFLVLTIAACDSADFAEVSDCATSLPPPERGPATTTACLDGGVAADARPATDTLAAQDTRPATDMLVQKLADAQEGYTDKGVYVNLGSNKCSVGSSPWPSKGGGWDPRTATCWGHEQADMNVTSGVCGNYACGTYAPGTVLVWDANNPRHRYWTGPEGGVVCLPNDVSYTIPCS